MDVTLNLLQQIILNVPNYIFWKDQHLAYRGCNKNFALSLGFNEIQDLIGKTDSDIPWTKKNASIYQEEDEYILKTGKSILGKEVLMSRDGEKDRYLSVSKVPLYDDYGNINGVLGIYIDITQSKESEKVLSIAKKNAEAANKAKTEFLENMRHDIRTPLTGIVGFSELLKTESSEQHIKKYADHLIASSHALLELLDEVLEAIGVSSGEIPKLKKKFNLQKTLQQVIDLHKAKAAQKQLELHFDFDLQIPTYVIGDKVRVQRIILELISNALNFTERGFVHLSARLAKKNERELVIEFIVNDSGIGIPKEKQQEIYVQFKRLTPSHKGIYQGTGLGLSVVKQFIEEVGGEIYVKSAPHKGTCFTCLIPLQESLLNNNFGIDDEPAIPPVKEDKRDSGFDLKLIQNPAIKHSVLLVEDHTIAQTVARSLLESLHCTIDWAENGKKALELCEKKSYDLIFMDIGLPDIDGYEVTHRIRKGNLNKNTHTPIIGLSAHLGNEYKTKCLDAGMNAVLNKPLTFENCLTILHTYLTKQEAASSISYSNDLPKKDEDLLNLSAFSLLDSKEGIKASGNKNLLQDMLRFLVNDGLPEDLALMKKAHASGDWNQTQQLAHKIKGGALYVGTIKMKMACQYFERYWKSGQQKHLEALYQQMVHVIEETVKEIKCWLKKVQ